ncbi:glycosyltransferase family 2 protein [Piscinibacter sp.]|uniref:glycosyltransferase family 2 protein n=1 Tax=Piscinibacter sp. TaxID=1903157 RepID=UPI0039E4B9DE
MNRFAVVLLNWNAVSDTIACLNSLPKAGKGSVSIVVDNGSEDDSVPRLLQWSRARGVALADCRDDDLAALSQFAAMPDLVLVRSKENLGFAKGCNLGLQAVCALGLEEVVFLNNDTVVAPRALSRLVERLRGDAGLFATIPLILVHGTRTIWNCGGRISRLGFRRYHHAGASLDATPLPAELECTFFTGCCFAVRTQQFAARGGFTERFFFGEEDFELCLWMLDHGKRAMVLTDCVVEHKVSAAFNRASRRDAARVYVYYLNRFIHMRLRLGRATWFLWLLLYLPYTAQLLLRGSAVRLRELPGFVWRLIRDAMRHDGVDRAKFMSVMKGAAG